MKKLILTAAIFICALQASADDVNVFEQQYTNLYSLVMSAPHAPTVTSGVALLATIKPNVIRSEIVAQVALNLLQSECISKLMFSNRDLSVAFITITDSFSSYEAQRYQATPLKCNQLAQDLRELLEQGKLTPNQQKVYLNSISRFPDVVSLFACDNIRWEECYQRYHSQPGSNYMGDWIVDR